MDIAELLQRAGVLYARNRQLNQSAKAAWYEIRNASEDEVEVYIYDEIGYWGVTANDFAQELRAITAPSIKLHLNSPGGDVFAGIAIHNALKAHRATVNVDIDALAASIASVIAMAGDNIAIAKNAQMMIHDAHGFTVGTANDHREMADLLDASSDIIAEVYADRAGGTTASWREAMKATSWYRGAEAVEAGLADEMLAVAPKTEDRSRLRVAARAEEPAPEVDPELFKQITARGYEPPMPSDISRLIERNMVGAKGGPANA